MISSISEDESSDSDDSSSVHSLVEAPAFNIKKAFISKSIGKSLKTNKVDPNVSDDYVINVSSINSIELAERILDNVTRDVENCTFGLPGFKMMRANQRAISPRQKKINSKNKKKTLSKSEPEEVLKRTIYAGNINLQTSRKALKKFFLQYGKVESVRIRGIVPENPTIPKKIAAITNQTHPSRKSAYAFVKFQEPESAIKACVANGVALDEHHLSIKLASEKGENTKNCIFVGNLPLEIEDEALWETFGECGKITNVRIVRSSSIGFSKGFGYISFESPDAVSLALMKNGSMCMGRPLRISLWASKRNVLKEANAQKKEKGKMKISGTSALFQPKKGKSNSMAQFLVADKELYLKHARKAKQKSGLGKQLGDKSKDHMAKKKAQKKKRHRDRENIVGMEIGNSQKKRRVDTGKRSTPTGEGQSINLQGVSRRKHSSQKKSKMSAIDRKKLRIAKSLRAVWKT